MPWNQLTDPSRVKSHAASELSCPISRDSLELNSDAFWTVPDPGVATIKTWRGVSVPYTAERRLIMPPVILEMYSGC